MYLSTLYKPRKTNISSKGSLNYIYYHVIYIVASIGITWLLRFVKLNYFRVYLALIELSKTEFDEREYNDAVSRLQA